MMPWKRCRSDFLESLGNSQQHTVLTKAQGIRHADVSVSDNDNSIPGCHSVPISHSHGEILLSSLSFLFSSSFFQFQLKEILQIMAAIYNGKEEKTSSVLRRAQITSVLPGIAVKVAVMCRTHSESVSRDARQRSGLEGKGKKSLLLLWRLCELNMKRAPDPSLVVVFCSTLRSTSCEQAKLQD